jgi:succinate dehydrogenase/fumarate reductase cytochrome b subunit
MSQDEKHIDITFEKASLITKVFKENIRALHGTFFFKIILLIFTFFFLIDFFLGFLKLFP